MLFHTILRHSTTGRIQAQTNSLHVVTSHCSTCSKVTMENHTHSHITEVITDIFLFQETRIKLIQWNWFDMEKVRNVINTITDLEVQKPWVSTSPWNWMSNRMSFHAYYSNHASIKSSKGTHRNTAFSITACLWQCSCSRNTVAGLSD